MREALVKLLGWLVGVGKEGRWGEIHSYDGWMKA